MKLPIPNRAVYTALVILLVAVAARVLVAAGPGESILEWIGENEGAGAVVLVLMNVAACVFFLPGLPVTLGAGFLYGLPVGMAIVTAGVVLGSTAAFLLGRTILRPAAEERVRRNPKGRALSAAVERKGFLFVLLLRLSPFAPYNLLTYVCALTRISYGKFIAGSLLGVTPVSAVYVYLGTLMKDVSDVAAGRLRQEDFSPALPIVAILVTAALLIYAARIAKRELRDAAASDLDGEGETG